MAIEVSCPGCERTLRLPDDRAGKRGKCPHCGIVMEIPKPTEEPEEGRQQESEPTEAHVSGKPSRQRSPLYQRISQGSGQFIRQTVWWAVGMGLLLCLLGLAWAIVVIVDLLRTASVAGLSPGDVIVVLIALIAPFFGATGLWVVAHFFIVVADINENLKKSGKRP